MDINLCIKVLSIYEMYAKSIHVFIAQVKKFTTIEIYVYLLIIEKKIKLINDKNLLFL